MATELTKVGSFADTERELIFENVNILLGSDPFYQSYLPLEMKDLSTLVKMVKQGLLLW